jgi:hypothetical protein
MVISTLAAMFRERLEDPEIREEHLAKLREANREFWQDPAVRMKLSLAWSAASGSGISGRSPIGLQTGCSVILRKSKVADEPSR